MVIGDFVLRLLLVAVTFSSAVFGFLCVPLSVWLLLCSNDYKLLIFFSVFRFWYYLQPYLTMHVSCSLPMSSSFCQGWGKNIYMHGKVRTFLVSNLLTRQLGSIPKDYISVIISIWCGYNWPEVRGIMWHAKSLFTHVLVGRHCTFYFARL